MERNYVVTILATLSLTQLILFWWPSLFLIHASRNRMTKRGKSWKEKGCERREVFNGKDGFQNRNKTDLYLQNKIKRNIFQISSVPRASISHSQNIFIALLCSVTLTVIIPPRQKTWKIFPLLCRPSHLPDKYFIVTYINAR